MIWLSPMAGTRECSIYFDIRDIDVRRTDSGTEGVVCGIVGDGCCEFWGEVSLGPSRKVDILPIWDAEENPTFFDEAVDLVLLKSQLAESIEKLFTGIGQLTAGERVLPGWHWPSSNPITEIAAAGAFFVAG